MTVYIVGYFAVAMALAAGLGIYSRRVWWGEALDVIAPACLFWPVTLPVMIVFCVYRLARGAE